MASPFVLQICIECCWEINTNSDQSPKPFSRRESDNETISNKTRCDGPCNDALCNTTIVQMKFWGLISFQMSPFWGNLQLSTYLRSYIKFTFSKYARTMLCRDCGDLVYNICILGCQVSLVSAGMCTLHMHCGCTRQDSLADESRSIHAYCLLGCVVRIWLVTS